MNDKRKEAAFLAMRDLELLHKITFARMANAEKNENQKNTLMVLSRCEDRHSKYWASLSADKREAKITASMRFTACMLQILRSIAGAALIVKIMERVEANKYARLDMFLSKSHTSKVQLSQIEEFRKNEQREEGRLENQIVTGGAVLSNIRDVIFGMFDGLVEVLAAVTGLGAALQVAPLVFVAGLIIAVSGTLSMASGAYLSTNYESELRSKESKSASRSAYYVGLFYFIGALFPVLPFAFGVGSYSGIMLSVVITMFVLCVVSVVMAVVSDTKIFATMTRTLLISLCAVVVTVLLGTYTRSVLHINI